MKESTITKPKKISPSLKKFLKKTSKKHKPKVQLPCGIMKSDLAKCYGQHCYHRINCEVYYENLNRSQQL